MRAGRGRYFRLDDPFSGLNREGWSLRETVHAQPTMRWTVRAGLGISQSTVQGGDGEGLDRNWAEIQTTWAATNAIVLNGSWSLWREQDHSNIRQSYSVAYSPGPKLSMSVAYLEYQTQDGMERDTASSDASVSYRLNRHASIFGSISRSKSTGGTDEGRITSARAGLLLSF